MLPYTLPQIAAILKIALPVPDMAIRSLLTDSRKLTDPEHTLFFALEGGRRSGHLFIEELYQKGVRCFVVAKSVAGTHYPDAVFLQVPDVLEALQHIAAQHRSSFTGTVIGITGSNGKTIVKEWLYQLLHTDRAIARSPKSYNSQIGVPLSIFQINPADSLAILEAGISTTGEMERLEKMIAPGIGILTNIGVAHSDGFTNDAQKLSEKLLLFTQAAIVIAHGDDDLVYTTIKYRQLPLFSWGKQSRNDVVVEDIVKEQGQTRISVNYQQNSFSFQIPFIDAASIENALTCCATLLYMSVSPVLIQQRMPLLHAVNMRLEYKKGINNCIVINDAYSADMNALDIALDAMQRLATHQQKTVILSDFADSKESSKFYHQLVIKLQQYGVTQLIGIGQEMTRFIPEILPGQPGFHYELFLTTADFLQQLPTSHFVNEVILVKGARSFGFEHIVQVLEQKVHQTILEINLDAITANLKTIQQVLQPATKIMAMVKAFAYGSGGVEIANILQFHKIDYLGVAYADEGVELRKAGITVPIMIMNPEITAFEAIVENNLEPDIYSFELLQDFQRYLEDAAIKEYPVHIEIETGMNRLGFAIEDVDKLARLLSNNSFIKVQSVFSHLAASEDPQEDAFSLHQYATLQKATGILKQQLPYPFLEHISNSAAIMRLPQLQMDMVRLGIGMYGISSNKNIVLQPAATLKSTIAQIKQLHQGDTVSYNRRGVIEKDTVIATVRIGYADGYSRKLGYGVGSMQVNGRLAPVIGTVCMDMTMLDITGIPDVKVGDEVIVFGNNPGIDSLAKAIGTIPYEIMTGISQRVKRVYYRE